MLRWDCFTSTLVYGSSVGCWLRITGWCLADWLADWLVKESPCHVECDGLWTEGASVYKIDYHVSGHVLLLQILMLAHTFSCDEAVGTIPRVSRP